MGLLEFCQQFVYLKGQLLSFAERDYLPDIYAATDRNLVLRCSRQVEKSTLLANRIIYEAATHPGIQMLMVCPRQEQGASSASFGFGRRSSRVSWCAECSWAAAAGRKSKTFASRTDRSSLFEPPSVRPTRSAA